MRATPSPGLTTPIMDVNNGGSGVAYPETLAKAAAGIKGVETVIPGHSAVTNWQGFLDYGEFMKGWVGSVSAAAKSGKTADQAADGLHAGGEVQGLQHAARQGEHRRDLQGAEEIAARDLRPRPRAHRSALRPAADGRSPRAPRGAVAVPFHSRVPCGVRRDAAPISACEAHRSRARSCWSRRRCRSPRSAIQSGSRAWDRSAACSVG